MLRLILMTSYIKTLGLRKMNEMSSVTSNSQNLAFLFLVKHSSTNEVSTASGDFRSQDRNMDFKEKRPVSLNKSKIECYNCHRKWHFARECRSGRNQGKRSYGDNGRSNAPTNESSSQALVAQDGLGGYDWSNDFEIEPVNYTFMAISSSRSSSSSDNKVQTCSKQCLESFKTLQKNYDSEREKHCKVRLEIQGYELALESLESRILIHEKNELAWGEKYEFQNYELKCKEIKINNLNMKLEKVVKEKDDLKLKIEKWEESSKNLDELLNSQMSARDKNCLDIAHKSSDEENRPVNDRFSKADGFHAVPPPITGNFLTPRADISFASSDEYAIRKKLIESKTTDLNTKTSETVVDNTVKVDGTGPSKSQGRFKRLREITWIRCVQRTVDSFDAQKVEIMQTVVIVVCSSHMTSNKAYLSDYEDFNGGFVAFESDPKGDSSLGILLLATKDETSEILCKLIIGLENQLNHNVKIIRCDNGTEFKNHSMNEFCAKKGIKKEFSVAKTPQQNGVAERKNRTLIEAARTMLTDSLLPIPFWAEAVNTACYVLNRATSTNKLSTVRSSVSTATKPYVSAMLVLPQWLDINNMDASFNASPIPTLRIHKNYPKDQILGDPKSAVQTRGKIQKTSSAQQALNPRIYHKPYKMKAGLKQCKRNCYNSNYRRLVAQGFRQEEGIDYDEVFAPVARIEATRLFLAFASYMGFTVYQMDVKSAFLYGTIKEDVYVHQPPGFVDPTHPNKVYKVIKALYGLHQAPRAWYETLSSFLMENGFRRGTIDKTLFIKKKKSDIMLVQVYVDDIIFGSTKKSMCTEFEDCMHKRFQMSSMGELTFFLGLQVKQQPDGIFISQDKYVADILKKFDFWSIRTATTPIESNKPLVKDEDGEDVDVHVYRSMIGSLMYLTASRPDIMFAVCACARFQVTPKASHLNAVKRIFRYLKHQPKLGLWYPRDSPFELEAFSDSDYGGASLDRKSTTGGCQFLGRRLISWQCKKQTIVANSTTEAEYVAAANCCGQVLWIQNQMMDYGFNFMNTKIHIDNESTISVIKNPVAHSRTKHIEIRFHFIRDCYEKRLIEVIKIHTDSNVADLLTKGFDVTRFNFLVVSIGMEEYDGSVFQQMLVVNHTTNGHQFTMSNRHQELTSPKQTALSKANGLGKDFPNPFMVGSLPKTIKQSNDPPLSRGYTLGSGEDSLELKELMENCTQIVCFVRKKNREICTTKEGLQVISTTIDEHEKLITEDSLRRHLKLDDAKEAFLHSPMKKYLST
ncbi:putative ribonuclease H-like domain-containing protein [Tanacetum coccineum]